MRRYPWGLTGLYKVCQRIPVNENPRSFQMTMSACLEITTVMAWDPSGSVKILWAHSVVNVFRRRVQPGSHWLRAENAALPVLPDFNSTPAGNVSVGQ